ncbi:MAG: SDR family NAD(P)-dependent oxidoreductase [Rhodothermales bacterium]
MRLAGKTALITGGGSGIGRAIAEAFAKEGARVAISGRRKENLDKTVETIGPQALGIQADVTDDSSVLHMAESAMSHWGRIDILVNNAATITSRTALMDTPIEDWDTMMNINVRGIFLCCKSVLPHMISQSAGSIINIASVAGQRGQPVNSAYSTTKGAVLNLTRSIAVDYGPHGIRCNSISPALVRTEMAETRLKQGENWEERAAREWVPNYPIGRIGTPEDIAYGALYLASDEASWVSGIDLTMDGGMMAKL